MSHQQGGNLDSEGSFAGVPLREAEKGKDRPRLRTTWSEKPCLKLMQPRKKGRCESLKVIRVGRRASSRRRGRVSKDSRKHGLATNKGEITGGKKNRLCRGTGQTVRRKGKNFEGNAYPPPFLLVRYLVEGRAGGGSRSKSRREFAERQRLLLRRDLGERAGKKDGAEPSRWETWRS